MASTGVLPFLRGIDISKNNLLVSCFVLFVEEKNMMTRQNCCSLVHSFTHVGGSLSKCRRLHEQFKMAQAESYST